MYLLLICLFQSWKRAKRRAAVTTARARGHLLGLQSRAAKSATRLA